MVIIDADSLDTQCLTSIIYVTDPNASAPAHTFLLAGQPRNPSSEHLERRAAGFGHAATLRVALYHFLRSSLPPIRSTHVGAIMRIGAVESISGLR